MLFKRRIKKAKKIYYEINENISEIERELNKIKTMLSVCQK